MPVAAVLHHCTVQKVIRSFLSETELVRYPMSTVNDNSSCREGTILGNVGTDDESCRDPVTQSRHNS